MNLLLLGLNGDLDAYKFIRATVILVNPVNQVYISSNRLTHKNSNSVYMHEEMNIRVDGEAYIISSIRRQTLQIEARHALDFSKHIILDINSPRISIDEEESILAYQIWLSTLRSGMSIDFVDLTQPPGKSDFYTGIFLKTSNDKLLIYMEDDGYKALCTSLDITPAYVQKGNTISWGKIPTKRFTVEYPIWGYDLPDSETNNRITAEEGAFSAGPILFQHTYPMK